MAKKIEKAYLVCTDKRGVFFGYTDEPIKLPQVTLRRARMCVYWDAATQGVLGLAATGPTRGCKITAAIPSAVWPDVHAVFEVSAEAVKAWENGPWA